MLADLGIEPWANLSGHVVLAVLCVMLVTKYIPALLDRHDKKEGELRDWHKAEMDDSRDAFKTVMKEHSDANKQAAERLAESLTKLSTEIRGVKCLNDQRHGGT